MNLGDIIREVGEIGVRNGRINTDIKGFVNRAQRAIAERRNWSWMKQTEDVTIPAGETSVNMPGDFKELDEENSAVSYTIEGSNIPIPVQVASRAQLNRTGTGWNRYWIGRYTQADISGVWMEPNGEGGWALKILSIAAPSSDLTFSVTGYYYPDDLEKAGDSNAFTRHGDVAEAIVCKAKALAYAALDDAESIQKAEMHAMSYERHIKQAIYADARKKTAGRALHM